ncbi:acyl carrier protein [Jatrophihabitans sp. GAS493]|uniref:acyl carrier protein n=1 Tax=Jatrophihabitans sp. GAS493 TaxID=1907575 RepID=UPI000BB97767|nr:acyl carrier protein [Jatrophihabitans sp. GAS493]SOD75026.1 acyl carrier protein [Jatrophihabitans sp. GAS493]
MRTPTLTDIRDSVRASLAEVVRIAPESVQMDRRLNEFPDVDSLALIELITDCEQQWGILLDEDELFDIRTGDDLAQLILRSLASLPTA